MIAKPFYLGATGMRRTKQLTLQYLHNLLQNPA